MSKFSASVIRNIQVGRLQPRPRWQYSLLGCSFWLAAIMSLVVGSLSFSVLIYWVSENDWDIYPNLHRSFAEYVGVSLPYLWIILIAFFTALTYHSFRKTAKGYKYEMQFLIAANIVLSTSLGSLAYWTHLAPSVEDTLAKATPNPVHQFVHFDDQQNTVWNKPENGLLAGEIVSSDNNNLTILAADNQMWHIALASAANKCPATFSNGSKIKIVGSKTTGSGFTGTEIRPWNKLETSCK